MRDHIMEMKMKQAMDETYKKVFNQIGGQAMQNSAGIFKLTVWVNVLIHDLLISRRRVLWLILLIMLSPRSARAYIMSLFEDRLNMILAANKEAACSSSQETTETSSEDSAKATQSGSSVNLEK